MNNTSNAVKPMAKKKKPKQKKVKAPAVAYLQIHWKNKDAPNGFNIRNFSNELMGVERYLKSVEGKWRFATLREAKTGNIYHYYHPKTGTKRLDLHEYKKQFESFSLYIIHTPSYRKRTGSQKGTSKRIYDLSKISDYWDYKDVLRIDVYQNKKLINRYENGKFLM